MHLSQIYRTIVNRNVTMITVWLGISIDQLTMKPLVTFVDNVPIASKKIPERRIDFQEDKKVSSAKQSFSRHVKRFPQKFKHND